jgi:hypothetical protein
MNSYRLVVSGVFRRADRALTQGAAFVHDGVKPAWFTKPKTGVHSAPPHHREIVDSLVRRIWRELGY